MPVNVLGSPANLTSPVPPLVVFPLIVRLIIYYNTIFKNIPKDTEISIGDTYYGILSEVENLEISLDTNDIYIIKMNNSSYNLSSQTFKLTAYEN